MPLRIQRYQALDSWRGAACLMVVLLHSALYLRVEGFDARVWTAGGSPAEWVLVAVGWGWVGVPFFFVISGYCIAASADADRERPGGAGHFLTRRFRRIYPPLWTALGLAVVIFATLPSVLRPPPIPGGVVPLCDPSALTWEQWAGNASLTELWRPDLGGPPRAYLLGQIWTLCYEEQFYLAVGLVLALARRWLFTAMWAITGGVLLNTGDLNALAGGTIDLGAYQVRAAGAFTNGIWIAFAAGVAVYYRLHRAPRVFGVVAEFLILAVCLTAARGVNDPWDGQESLAKYNTAACGFALLLCRLHRFDAVLSAYRWAAPLRFCGRTCYSLYLTHPLVAIPAAGTCYRVGLVSPAATVLVTLPVCLGLSVGLGYLFHRYVERAFLARPGRAGQSTAVPEFRSGSRQEPVSQPGCESAVDLAVRPGSHQVRAARGGCPDGHGGRHGGRGVVAQAASR